MTTILRRLWLTCNLLLPIGIATSQPIPVDLTNEPHTGLQRYLMVQLVYPNSLGPVMGPEFAQNVATELEALMEDNAYGNLDLEVDCLSVPIVMPQSYGSYYTGTASNPHFDVFKLWTDAYATIGLDAVAPYSRVIFVTDHFPSSSQGIGTIDQFTIFANPGNTNVAQAARLLCHEFGHTGAFGIEHANFWVGQVPGLGWEKNYGDKFDVMGPPGAADRHFNPMAKRRLGWLLPPDFVTVTGPGPYDLRNYESIGTGSSPAPAALRIDAGDGNEYWVFKRTRGGPAVSGVFVTWSHQSNMSRSVLLDATPGSEPGPADADDARLVPDNEPPYASSSTMTLAPGLTIRLHAETSGSTVVVVDQFPSSPPPPSDLPILSLMSSSIPAKGTPVTGHWRYEAVASDPAPAPQGGIKRVLLRLYPSTAEVVREQFPVKTAGFENPHTWPRAVRKVTESIGGYVASSEWMNAPTNGVWPLDVCTNSLPSDGRYILVVLAETNDGRQNVAFFHHMVKRSDCPGD